MKTHKELLTELIDAVYALHISPTIKEVHDMQMKAAEIRGQILATNPLQNETPSPPDADGWVVNTGKKPECEISAIKFRDETIGFLPKDCYRWNFANSLQNKNADITHYKPA